MNRHYAHPIVTFVRMLAQHPRCVHYGSVPEDFEEIPISTLPGTEFKQLRHVCTWVNQQSEKCAEFALGIDFTVEAQAGTYDPKGLKLHGALVKIFKNVQGAQPVCIVIQLEEE